MKKQDYSIWQNVIFVIKDFWGLAKNISDYGNFADSAYDFFAAFDRVNS